MKTGVRRRSWRPGETGSCANPQNQAQAGGEIRIRVKASGVNFAGHPSAPGPISRLAQGSLRRRLRSFRYCGHGRSRVDHAWVGKDVLKHNGVPPLAKLDRISRFDVSVTPGRPRV